MKLKLFLSVILITICGYHSLAQSLAINNDGSIANVSALLDVKSTAKGMLLPRMSRTERNAIATPATGLLIFQNGPDSVGFHYYDGIKWTWLLSNSNTDSLAWRTKGNIGTTDATNFIGTVDNVPFNIRVNNQKAGRIDNTLANSFWGYQAGNSISSGNNNTAIGLDALYNNTTANNNTAVGSRSLFSNTTGSHHVAIGYNAMLSNNGFTGHVAIGAEALKSNINGDRLVAVGFQALTNSIQSNNNTAIGYQSLMAAIGSPFNTAIGTNALSNLNTLIGTGGENTAIGDSSMYHSTLASYNTAIGRKAMFGNLTGEKNVSIGVNSLQLNTSGSQHVAIGYNAMLSNNGFTGHVAIGAEALKSNINGDRLVAVGFQALTNSTQSNNNTAIGYQSLMAAIGSPYNTAIGTNALSNLNTLIGTGGENTAIGDSVMYNSTLASYNTAIGRKALFENTTGEKNVSIGVNSLKQNISGSRHVAIGYNAMLNSFSGAGDIGIGAEALMSNNTGIRLVAVGYQALTNSTQSDNNTAIGYQSLMSAQGSPYNTAIGTNALSNLNTLIGTGGENTAIGDSVMYNSTLASYNTAIGRKALFENTTGEKNVAIGKEAMYKSTGSNNTIIGNQSGYNLTAGSNNVFLGNQAGYNVTSASNKLYVANNSTDPPIIYGDFSNKTLGLGTINPNSTYGFAKVEIASEGFGSPADLLIRNAVNDPGYAPGLVFQHARGTLAAPLTVNNGDYLSAISTMNYDGSNYILSAGLDIYADGTISAGKVPTKLQFNTMNTTGNYAARLTIKNDGKVGIGTTTPSAKLHIGGGTRFTVLDTGAIFLQSGNLIGSARDWKIAVTLPNGYLSFRDMGFDNSGTGAMATDAMVMAWGTGNIGIATPTPAARLDVAADFKLGASGSVNNALIKTTQNIDVGSIPANSELDVTVAVANANTGNSAVFVSPVADIESGIVIAWVRVSAANTVKIRFRNTTGSPIDPVAINYVISVLQ